MRCSMFWYRYKIPRQHFISNIGDFFFKVIEYKITWAVIHSNKDISPVVWISFSFGGKKFVLVVAVKLIDDDDVDDDTVDLWYIPFEVSSKAINLFGSLNWWRISIAWGRLNNSIFRILL